MPRTVSTDRDFAWNLLLAAARDAARAERDSLKTPSATPTAFALTADATLQPVSPGDPEALLAWRQDAGWENRLSPADPWRALVDLYLPICAATDARPLTLGHLGQSLDGFIATHSGESRWVTGEENIVHLHRLRALCDAVVVGAGTVAADDPQLTTRLVPGPNPLRVVLDPTRRLSDDYRVFADGEAETVYACAESLIAPGEQSFGRASVLGLSGDPTSEAGVDLSALLRALHARGCARIFVEGGGVTVSMFLAANLLDRLHMAVAPLIIGDGKPAIRLPPRAALVDCHRPRYRVFKMGGDVLFDCEIGTSGDVSPGDSEVVRVI
jgi:riboflavin-specific deaminase-like protein